jgi:multidrug efflux system outer membrane protein
VRIRSVLRFIGARLLIGPAHPSVSGRRCQRARAFTTQSRSLAASAQDAARLSDLRYRGGFTSYLEVLTSETNFFSAELGLAQARLNELLALVQLYVALGGGWQQ